MGVRERFAQDPSSTGKPCNNGHMEIPWSLEDVMSRFSVVSDKCLCVLLGGGREKCFQADVPSTGSRRGLSHPARHDALDKHFLDEAAMKCQLAAMTLALRGRNVERAHWT